MRRFPEQTGSNVTHLPRRDRLETPSTTGYRPGMSSCSVIGRKLGSMYDVPGDHKYEIECALQTLDHKLAGLA